MAKKDEEKMTVEEAGEMGGEKGGKRSWTANPNADRPELDEETRREVERIREKEARGEKLTLSEAGKLGGAKRVEDSGKK